MLSRSTSQVSCRNCIYETRSVLIKRSFKTACRSKGRKFRHQHYNPTKVGRLNFSNTSRQFVAKDEDEPKAKISPSFHESIHEDADHASQAAIIELLEKELGKPLEDAIKEDKIAAQIAARYIDEDSVSSVTVIPDSSSISAISRLRNAGAPSADVAREARQLHGDFLPEGTLNEEELSVYTRLYGNPAEETNDNVQGVETPLQHELYSPEGEPIEYRTESELHNRNEPTNESQPILPADLSLTRARTLEVAQSLQGSVIEENEFDDIDEDEDGDASSSDKGHPLTNMGRFKTAPKTVFLPQEAMVEPIEHIMSGYSNKHLKETCERIFGGPGLPDSALTPRSGRSRKQVAIPLEPNQNTMGEMEANAYMTTIMPPTYASVLSVLTETRKRLGATWLTKLLAKETGPRVLDAGAGGAGIIAWREIVQAHWNSLHTSDRGSSSPPATKSVVLTGSDTLRHRAAALLENTTFVPRLPDYVHARTVPTLEDDRPAQQRKQFDVIIAPHVLFGLKEDWMRKQYVQNLWSLLSEDGGVLILIEKGIPRGFEAIAEVREMLLDRYIAVPEGQSTHYSQNNNQVLNEDGIHKKTSSMIVAPCTNHERCPMYTAPGLSRGRRDICSFQQRYIRPPFLQRVLGAKDRNHDDVDFSYLSVIKGDDMRSRNIGTWNHLVDPLSAPLSESPTEQQQIDKASVDEARAGFEHVTPEIQDQHDQDPPSLPAMNQLPRIIYPPLKRRGHVTMDLCTSTGHIERWTIPRSFSHQAYQDARKSKWGDLWALGAKTHVSRNLQLGTPEKDLFGKNGEVIPGKGRGRKERLRIKAQEMLERHEQEKAEDLMEQRDLMAALDDELEAQAAIPKDEASIDLMRPKAKPMNNRERKQARKAQRSAQQSIKSTSHTQDGELNQSEIEYEMAEWQAEYEQVAKPGKGKKGGAYNKFGSSTRAAKSLQKNKDKTGEFVRR